MSYFLSIIVSAITLKYDRWQFAISSYLFIFANILCLYHRSNRRIDFFPTVVPRPEFYRFYYSAYGVTTHPDSNRNSQLRHCIKMQIHATYAHSLLSTYTITMVTVLLCRWTWFCFWFVYFQERDSQAVGLREAAKLTSLALCRVVPCDSVSMLIDMRLFI